MRRQAARELLEQAPEEILPRVAFDPADLAAFVGDAVPNDDLSLIVLKRA